MKKIALATLACLGLLADSAWADDGIREPTVEGLGNGVIVKNLGCKTAGGQRWCKVARPEAPDRHGWVAGRYLRESSPPQ
jgi:hypothetical protein